MVQEKSSEPTPLTQDTILGGKIRVFQEKQGYRFSLDAVLLSHFVQCSPNAVIVDLGAGSGIIPLILASIHPSLQVYGVEMQDSLVTLAQRNVQENSLDHQVTIIHHDFKLLQVPDIPSRVDWVVSNPPYRRLGSGRVNPQSQKAMARHEILANLQDVVRAGARLLDKGGRFAVIYPASRLADLIHCMKENGLEPKRLRVVHSNMESPARLVLLEAIKGAGPQIAVEKPLFIYRDEDTYSDEVISMLYPP